MSNPLLITARAWSALCVVLAIVAASLKATPDVEAGVILLMLAALPWVVFWIIRGFRR